MQIETPVATRVTAAEVAERMRRGEELVFVDNRNPQAWEESDVKLPGAIRIPADEVERHAGELPRDRTIITYCTSLNEGSSARAAQTLLGLGFHNVHPLYGGFERRQSRRAKGTVLGNSSAARRVPRSCRGLHEGVGLGK